MFTLVLVNAPTREPVTLAEAKLHLRVDGSDDDALIEAQISQARQHVENVTGRALLTQTWDYSLSAWPGSGRIVLPFGNLQSVTSVTWKDEDGTVTTLTVTTDYLVHTRGDQCGHVGLPYGGTWPTGTLYPFDAITVRYVCGWTSPVLVPTPLKAAVLMVLADLYENRESQLVAAMTQAYSENKTVKALLANYRIQDEF